MLLFKTGPYLSIGFTLWLTYSSLFTPQPSCNSGPYSSTCPLSNYYGMLDLSWEPTCLIRLPFLCSLMVSCESFYFVWKTSWCSLKKMYRGAQIFYLGDHIIIFFYFFFITHNCCKCLERCHTKQIGIANIDTWIFSKCT